MSGRATVVSLFLVNLACCAVPPVDVPLPGQGSSGGSSGSSAAAPANVVASSSSSSGTLEPEVLVELRGDSTWKVSSTAATTWLDVGFDDSAWAAAASPAPMDCGWVYTPETIGRPHAWWEHPGTPTFWDTGVSPVLYARKRFSIAAANVTSAMLTSIADDDHEVFLNGVPVDSEASTASGPVLQTDISAYLVDGENVLAVRGVNNGGCAWFLMDGVILSAHP